MKVVFGFLKFTFKNNHFFGETILRRYKLSIEKEIKLNTLSPFSLQNNFYLDHMKLSFLKRLV